MEKIIDVDYKRGARIRIFDNGEQMNVWVDRWGDCSYETIYEVEYSGYSYWGAENTNLDDKQCIADICDGCIMDIESQHKGFSQDEDWESIYTTAKNYYDAKQILSKAM